MQAFELWAAYTAAVINAEVQEPAEKFAALSESERNAWESVQTLAGASAPVKTAAPAVKPSTTLPGLPTPP